ncbi:MAG: DUF4255 domain-containing protein [Chloroflexi bacterium]|nr:DUF4255 domain-containing protein [Chloroflexota bacterium]
MAMIDMSLVTSTLVRLLDEHVSNSSAWNPAIALNLTPDPPDKLTGDNTLGLYLYRVTEDAQYKNLPQPGSDSVPIRQTPMALTLDYILVAHSDIDDPPGTGAGAIREQLMMGLAMKTLHDYPVVDDATQVGGTTVMEPSLIGGGNRFRISMNPVARNESFDIWSAASSPVRLAAYYSVSVALLEPEQPRNLPGRVLTYGVHVFANGAPRLTGSRNELTFLLPNATDDTIVEARPAQAAAGEEVAFSGSALHGDSTDLLLRGPGFVVPTPVDAVWNLALAASATEESITVEVQDNISGATVLPGVYAASARVTRTRTMPDGSSRDFTNTSNEIPFVISPQIDPLPVPTAAGVVAVTGHIFQHADLVPENVIVFAGADRLVVDSDATLDPGEFSISGPNDMDLRLPAGLASGQNVQIRIVINGAESAPQWVTVP